MAKLSKLVVFFIPPDKAVNGGILSIFSLAKESRVILKDRADVCVCVYPGSPTYNKNDLFDNDENIYEFDTIIKNHPSPAELILHIPEYAVAWFAESLQFYASYLSHIPSLQINILNQNITLMPDPVVIARLFAFTTDVTQSTAHNRYCTQEFCNQYAIPTHLMSIFMDKRQYKPTDFGRKNRVILLSPDSHPLKERIIKKMQQDLEGYTLKEIENLTYEEYKQAISEASFVITFGEGFDAYFFEPAYSKTVPFSVYNEDFFPGKEFFALPNVFSSYDEMLEKIVPTIKALSDEGAYAEMAEQTSKLLGNYYGYEKYIGNLESFYGKKYTYAPSPVSIKALIGKVIINQGIAKAESERTIAEMESRITTLTDELQDKRKSLESINRSLSWRITRPLRTVKLQYKNIKNRR